MKEVFVKIENKKPKLTPIELIEFRSKQSKGSRLAEYITGLRPDDPAIVEKLLTDQERIRIKYDLPDRRVSFVTPTEYERLLRDRANKLGVVLKEKSDCGTFFRDNSGIGGVYFRGLNVIGATINKDSLEDYSRTLGILEHELIHAEQNRDSYRMPIELKEYEAYIAGMNIDMFRDYPEDIEWIIFQFFIGGSVRFWYDKKNENHKLDDAELVPVWDDPNYFLKHVDKVDDKLIDGYRLPPSTI